MGALTSKNQITWFDLLHETGENLWLCRQALLEKYNSNNDEIYYIPLSHFRADKGKQICMLMNSKIFKETEEKEGMTKGAWMSKRSKSLTAQIGDEWKRQANVIRSKDGIFAQYDIKQTSINISKKINPLNFLNKSDINKNNEITVCLKEFVMKITSYWVINLWFGYYDENIGHNFLTYWTSIREYQNKNSRKTIDKNKKNFADTFNFDNGLLYLLKKSPLEEDVVRDNIIHAMVAAFETTTDLVFWTVWNLSHLKNHSEIVKKCSKENIEQTNKIDYESLSIIKKKSTHGQSFSYKNINDDSSLSLSYLGRALVESVRYYPPVWTLPRIYTGNNKNCIATKLDVLISNNGLDRRAWNPNNDDRIQIYSQGTGKRHCPAGTAALLAAYIILGKFVNVFNEWKECKENNAIHTAYLGPTLNCWGKQNFTFKVKSLDELKEIEESALCLICGYLKRQKEDRFENDIIVLICKFFG